MWVSVSSSVLEKEGANSCLWHHFVMLFVCEVSLRCLKVHKLFRVLSFCINMTKNMI